MKRTKLYNIHKKLGAKIVLFAGFEMPIQYSSIISEHKAVRNSLGIFDVSHMGELFVSGKNAIDFLQEITVNDASKLFPGRVQYSAMCYPDGGIVDDLLVYMITENEFMLVVNAANIDKDFEWMSSNNNFAVKLENRSDLYSLIAVQGPRSKDVIQKLTSEDLDRVAHYHFVRTDVGGINLLLSRTGYTGELGYELYFTGDEKIAENLWNTIFEVGKEFNIQPTGLAARDSLRLEMGFCLYGNDIDKTTNPLEAGLGWITKLNKENFIGKDCLLRVKAEGLKRKLCGLVSEERIFPRQGYEIRDNERTIGKVTSGTVSPVLEKPIALCYLESDYVAEENEVKILIRGNEIPAKVVKLPFIKRNL